MTEFSEESLIQFLLTARKQCWAGNGHEIFLVQRPDFKEFEFSEKSWSYRDSYAGFYSAPGQEVIRYANLPVWSMSYVGGVLPELMGKEKECKNIFGFLKRALMKTTFDHAFRGPKEYEEQDLLYQCHAEGTCSQFSGREVIFQKNKTVFIQQFIGGSIVHKLKS